MKDIVNARVKHREGFRPFAPAILHEDGDEYFEDYHLNPFMLLVLPVRPTSETRSLRSRTWTAPAACRA